MGKRAAKESAVKTPRSRIATRIDLLPGASPGTLTPIAGSHSATISILSIDGDRSVTVKQLDDFTKLPNPVKSGVKWVRVIGLGNVVPLLDVTEFYGIRRLALEDTLSPGWRTKMEEHGEFAFFLLQAPPEAASKRRGDHLSLFCKPGLVISFEEAATPLVDLIWESLQKHTLPASITHMAEFCTYLVLDYMVDSFFPHLDEKDEILAELEECFGHAPKQRDLNRLHQVKRSLITLRRLLSPFKEVRADLLKYHELDTAKELRPYFNDLGDHIIQAGELLDTYYEVAESLDDMFQTMLSNRMNDIIRILTIISTIFMPLTFIVGVYGMNFEFMPELGWRYGYPIALGIMAAIVVGMIWYFKKKDWL
ncbi:MAG: Cobalt/magnesium transport protein CorA [Desulfovibrio sp.]